MPVPFTQYLLPDGRKRSTSIEMPPEIEALAKEIIGAGAHFDIEVLQTGVVSMTCEKGDKVLSIELSVNGLEIVEHTTLLVQKAHARLFPKKGKEVKVG